LHLSAARAANFWRYFAVALEENIWKCLIPVHSSSNKTAANPCYATVIKDRLETCAAEGPLAAAEGPLHCES